MVSAVALGLGAFASWPTCRHAFVHIGLVTLAVTALKFVLALTSPRYGLEASYFANDRFNGLPESSTVAPGTPYTRLDTALDFGSDEFPLFFFNDQRRFNSLGPDRLDRGRALPWSVVWSGYLIAPRDATTAIALTASGPGELFIDGQRLLKVEADGRATARTEVQLTRGPHAVEARYVRKKERSPYFRVTTDLTAVEQALAAPRLAASAYAAERLELDQACLILARTIDATFLVLLAVALTLAIQARVRDSLRAGHSRFLAFERPLLGLVPLGMFLEATVTRLDRPGKMVFLGGGQDWLNFETYARDIQFNGLLMTLGKPLGQGEVLLIQPLYPYYLAALHTLVGEDLFGLTTLQALSLGVACVCLYEVARRLFDRLTAVVTLLLLVGVLVPFELGWVARRLLSENAYFVALPAAAVALLMFVERPTLHRAAAAGMLVGLACLSRGPTLLWLPPVGWLIWRSLLQRRVGAGYALRCCIVAGVCAAALISLLPLRNQIVAGKPNITAASGGINLEKFHRPSRFVRLAGLEDDPLQRLLNVDRPTREVIEYIRQDPAGYFASYLPLAAYTVGVGSSMNELLDETPVQLHPGLLILGTLYVIAVLGLPRARTAKSAILHSFIGSHFLTMLVFSPYDYENRLVLPMYLFVTIFSAAALATVCGFVSSRISFRALPSGAQEIGLRRATTGGSEFE